MHKDRENDLANIIEKIIKLTKLAINISFNGKIDITLYFN